MGFESIVKTIGALPPLPESVRRLDEAFRSGTPETRKIVSIIENDPMLTATLLARVNSASTGVRNRVVSVMQAVTLFGLETVRSFALKAAMEQNFEIEMSPYGIGNEAFGRISMMQSQLMFQWFMGIDVEKAKILLPVVFLMETGKVIIAREIHESDYEAMFREALESSASIGTVEEDFAGIRSEKVAALLFRHWNFEAIFVQLMELLDDITVIPAEYREMMGALRAVRTAVNVKEQLSEQSVANAIIVVEEMGWDALRFANAARRVREKFGLE